MSPNPLHLSFTEADQLAALRGCADILFARQPCHQAYCTVWLRPNTLEVHAEWRWPGVVRCSVRRTGQLIAESEPGKPYELAGPDNSKR